MLAWGDYIIHSNFTLNSQVLSLQIFIIIVTITRQDVIASHDHGFSFPGDPNSELSFLPSPIDSHQNFFPSLGYNSLEPLHTYIADGRLIKPYEVMEHQEEDDYFLNPNNNVFIPSQPLPPQSSLTSTPQQQPPLQLTYNPYKLFDPNYPTNAIDYSGFNFPSTQPRRAPKPNPVFQRNHGPVALGSGSLGYIRLPNGVVFIGSGSLGYISESQHTESVEAVKKQRQNSNYPIVPSGPLLFGHGRR